MPGMEPRVPAGIAFPLSLSLRQSRFFLELRGSRAFLIPCRGPRPAGSMLLAGSCQLASRAEPAWACTALLFTQGRKGRPFPFLLNTLLIVRSMAVPSSIFRTGLGRSITLTSSVEQRFWLMGPCGSASRWIPCSVQRGEEASPLWDPVQVGPGPPALVQLGLRGPVPGGPGLHRLPSSGDRFSQASAFPALPTRAPAFRVLLENRKNFILVT